MTVSELEFECAARLLDEDERLRRKELQEKRKHPLKGVQRVPLLINEQDKNHINELCSKLSKTVGIISKLRCNVNVDILTMLYYSLIYPFLI